MLLESNPNTDVRGLTVLHSKSKYVVVTTTSTTTSSSGNLKECDLTKTSAEGGQHSFIGSLEGGWDPTDVIADDDKRIVYVMDRSFGKVYVLNYEFENLGTLAQSAGLMSVPDHFTIMPGVVPVLSSVPPRTDGKAGSTILLPITLRDRLNRKIPAETPVTADSYQVKAVGLIPGTLHETTIFGSVRFDPAVPAATSLTASIEISYAGEWTVHVTEGSKNEQHLGGTPFVVSITPASTDPAECTTEYSNALMAGESFDAALLSFDSYKNPTSAASDSFSGVFEGRNYTSSATFARTDAGYELEQQWTKSGSYKLGVYHSSSDSGNPTEVAYSPFHFEVSPRAIERASERMQHTQLRLTVSS
jgi:hypothetical protein